MYTFASTVQPRLFGLRLTRLFYSFLDMLNFALQSEGRINLFTQINAFVNVFE